MELPCNDCGSGGYGEYKPHWCRLLGRIVVSVDDIPMYYDKIPGLKPDIGCMGFMKKDGE